MPRPSKANLRPLPFNDIQTFGQRITNFRQQRGLSQRALGKIIGITQGLISDYETGKLRMYDEMILRFCLALQVPPNELLGYTPALPMAIPVRLSARFLKRLAVIERFPEPKKKRILENLDDAIRSHVAEHPESSSDWLGR
jgi:transcriptional regulator with XRE-family HTH domain